MEIGTILSTMSQSQKQTVFQSNFEVLAIVSFSQFANIVRNTIHNNDLLTVGVGVTDEVVIQSINEYMGISRYYILNFK